MSKSKMVAVYPIRWTQGGWQHLIIKRATPAYNWQCVTGGVQPDEDPLSCAHRELFEETGYKAVDILSYNFNEDYLIDDIEEGDHDDELLRLFKEEIDLIVFIAIIQDPKSPLIDPKEHTDWKWADFDSIYHMVNWAVEKKQHRLIRSYIDTSDVFQTYKE